MNNDDTLKISITLVPHAGGWLASLEDDSMNPDEMPIAEAIAPTRDQAVAALVASVTFDNDNR